MINNSDPNKTEYIVQQLSKLMSEKELTEWLSGAMGDNEASFFKESSLEDYATHAELYHQYENLSK